MQSPRSITRDGRGFEGANFNPTVLFKRINTLDFPRERKADQYGLRFSVLYEDQPIKVERVAEGRIELEPAAAYL